MKRWWIKVVGFIAFTMLLYVAVVWSLCHIDVRGRPLIYRTTDYYHWRGGEAYVKFREFNVSKRWDAVIIGSSHALYGYDPFVFAEHGYQAFNLGTNAQGPSETYFLIEQYLDSSNTSLLIFDQYEAVYTKSALESASLLISNIPSDKVALKMAWGLRDIRGLNLMAARLGLQDTPIVYEDEHYKGSGFCAVPDSLKTPLVHKERPVIQIDPDQARALVRCLDLCKRKGIRVVLTSQFGQHAKDQRPHQVMCDFLDRTIAHTGVSYLDLNDGQGISDNDHFYDHSHLNSAGAKIFTGRLVDSLEALGYLRKP